MHDATQYHESELPAMPARLHGTGDVFDDMVVSLAEVSEGDCTGVVQAGGFEFPFTACMGGGQVWLWFEPRRGDAELVFSAMEDDLRLAARAALRRLAA